MMSSPFFSIIIPTYNRESFIIKAVQSVIEQTNQDFEVIVVDDGSTDNTKKAIIPLLSEKVFYFKIENSERGAARNYGMHKAHGKYITFLDSDDIYYPNYLSNANTCLNNLGHPGFFQQAYEVKTEDNHLVGVTRPGSSNLYKAISKGNFMSCMGVFIKKEVTNNYQFNEDRKLSGSEDWEFWVRIMSEYGLKSSSTVCSAMIVHENRSVLAISEKSLAERKNLAMTYAFENEKVNQVFKKYKNYMIANWDTYISLHLILDFQNKTGINYLFQAIKRDPVVVIEKRFLSIIRIYLFNRFGFRKKK